jgi:hypothetical protein
VFWSHLVSYTVTRSDSVVCLSECLLVCYCANKARMSRKSEHAVDGDRVLKFLYDADSEVITAVVLP